MRRRIDVRKVGAGAASALVALAVVAVGSSGGAAAKGPAKVGQALPAARAPSAVPGGYTLVHSAFVSAPNGTVDAWSIRCPVSNSGVVRYPQGGGVLVSSGSLFANISETDPTGPSWRGSVSNASGATTTFQVWAVCAKPHGAYSQNQSASMSIPPGSQVGGFEACPSGTKVLGGGLIQTGTFHVSVNVNSSYPASNGWHVDLNNAGSDTDAQFVVFAVCSKYSISKTGYGVHEGATVDNPPGAQTFASADCPSGQVPLGGGGFSSSSLTSVNMNSSYPTQGPAGSAQGWGVYENNASASDHSITPYVICAS